MSSEINHKKVVLLQPFLQLFISLHYHLININSYEVSQYKEGTGCMAEFAAAVGEGSGKAQSPFYCGFQLQQ